jgi:acyl-CoA thioester hydrolase
MTGTTVDYGHRAIVPVHFDDLDALGVLHNSRYAVLIERAMINWWADRGVSFAGGRPTSPDAFNVVREYSITFHVPVRGTGDLAVHFWLETLGTTSADYRFRFTSLNSETVYAEGRRVNIHLDPATMRPSPWTREGREIGAALLRG